RALRTARPATRWPAGRATASVSREALSRATRSRRDLRPRSSSCHGRQENHRRAGAYLRVDAFACPHVLAFDVDVDERGDVVVLDELTSQRGEASHQIVEELAHRVALGGHFARAADLLAQGRWDADAARADGPCSFATRSVGPGECVVRA